MKTKRSKNYYDVLLWLKKVINSVNSHLQYDACDKLLSNFYKMYIFNHTKSKDYIYRRSDYYALQDLLLEKL